MLFCANALTNEIARAHRNALLEPAILRIWSNAAVRRCSLVSRYNRNLRWSASSRALITPAISRHWSNAMVRHRLADVSHTVI